MQLRQVVTSDFPLIKKWLHKDYIKSWYGEPEEWMDEIKNESGEFEWLNHYIVELENPVQIIADPVKENVKSIRLLEKKGFILDEATGLYKLRYFDC